MTALPEIACQIQYVVVPRKCGQQLKEPAQLDGWLRDGSAEYVEGLCKFEAGSRATYFGSLPLDSSALNPQGKGTEAIAVLEGLLSLPLPSTAVA